MYRVTLATVSLLLLVGCSNTNLSVDRQLDDLSQIPVPAGFMVYEGPEETTFDTLILATKQAYESQPKNLETQYYWMSETVKWEEVERFYEDAFANSDWSAAGMAFNTVSWTRNGNGEQQVLVISAVPLTSSEGHILVIILVSG
jgi:hypothetical protein